MSAGKAAVRLRVEEISGVSRTWFEWSSYGDPFKKVLVVEVDADIDPNSPHFNEGLLEQISSEVAHVLDKETTMVVSGLKVVPSATYI